MTLKSEVKISSRPVIHIRDPKIFVWIYPSLQFLKNIHIIIWVMSEQDLRVIFLTNEIDLDAKGGGSQRSKMLVTAIKDSLPINSKFEILQISFYEFERFPEAPILDLPVAQDIEFAINLRNILQKEPGRLRDLIQSLVNADYIFVDNCYLAPIIEFVAELNKKAPRIIYVSHNHEQELKATTAKQLKWPARKAELYIQVVSECENFLWRNSETRIVCSTNDAMQLNNENMKDFIHIPNGGYIRSEPKLSKEKILEFLGCQSYSLFVASGHPPNIDGFLQGIGIDFGFIPRESRLVLVGSSVGPIETEISGTKFHETFLNKGSVIPEASNDFLDNLYAYASSIVLPIFSGSGTSIKSVEALLSNRHLIATRFAFRGINLSTTRESQIDFCSSQNEFKSAISRSLNDPFEISEPTIDILKLEWSQVQVAATSEIKKIFQLEKSNG